MFNFKIIKAINIIDNELNTRSKKRKTNNTNKRRQILYIIDEITHLEYYINEYDINSILVGLPNVLKMKSKTAYPYVINQLDKNLNIFLKKIQNSGFFKSIYFSNMEIEPSDEEYFDERIKFISEKDNINIYDKIAQIEKIFKNKIYLKDLRFIFPIVNSFIILNNINDFYQNQIYLNSKKELNLMDIVRLSNDVNSSTNKKNQIVFNNYDYQKQILIKENIGFSCLFIDEEPTYNNYKISTNLSDKKIEEFSEKVNKFDIYDKSKSQVESKKNNKSLECEIINKIYDDENLIYFFKVNNDNDNDINNNNCNISNFPGDKDNEFNKSLNEKVLNRNSIIKEPKSIFKHKFCPLDFSKQTNNFNEFNIKFFKNFEIKDIIDKNINEPSKIEHIFLDLSNHFQCDNASIKNKHFFSNNKVYVNKDHLNFSKNISSYNKNDINPYLNSKNSFEEINDFNDKFTHRKSIKCSSPKIFNHAINEKFSWESKNFKINDLNSQINIKELISNPLKISKNLIEDINLKYFNASDLEVSSKNQNLVKFIDNPCYEGLEYIHSINNNYSTKSKPQLNILYPSKKFNRFFSSKKITNDLNLKIINSNNNSDNDTELNRGIFNKNFTDCKDNENIRIKFIKNFEEKNQINRISNHNLNNTLNDHSYLCNSINRTSASKKNNNIFIENLDSNYNEINITDFINNTNNKINSKSVLLQGKINEFKSYNFNINNEILNTKNINIKLNHYNFELNTKKLKNTISNIPLEVFSNKKYIELGFIFSKLNKHIYIDEKNQQIEITDEDFLYCLNYFICDFFSYWIHYFKNLKRDEEEKKEQEIIELKENEDKIILKPSIKNFKKELILIRDECETDYGEKRISKKERKERKDYVENQIKNGNKEYLNSIEDDIAKGKLDAKPKKVTFLIPTDRHIILNNLKK